MKWKLSFATDQNSILVDLPNNPRSGEWTSLQIDDVTWQAQWHETLSCLYLKDANGLEQAVRVRYGSIAQFPGEAQAVITLELAESGHSLIGKFQATAETFLPGAVGRGKKANAAGSLVRAPMVGKVLGVRVQSGDTVAKGQELLVIEAMKMENKIVSPAAGVVKEVNCAAGDQTKIGQKLVVIA